jgi:hypothetical protein
MPCRPVLAAPVGVLGYGAQEPLPLRSRTFDDGSCCHEPMVDLTLVAGKQGWSEDRNVDIYLLGAVVVFFF